MLFTCSSITLLFLRLVWVRSLPSSIHSCCDLQTRFSDTSRSEDKGYRRTQNIYVYLSGSHLCRYNCWTSSNLALAKRALIVIISVINCLRKTFFPTVYLAMLKRLNSLALRAYLHVQCFSTSNNLRDLAGQVRFGWRDSDPFGCFLYLTPIAPSPFRSQFRLQV